MESRLQIQEHPHVARAKRAGADARPRLSLRSATAPAAPLSLAELVVSDLAARDSGCAVRSSRAVRFEMGGNDAR